MPIQSPAFPPEPTLDSIPNFDPEKFQPPAWAKTQSFQWGTDPSGKAPNGVSKLDLSDDESDGDEDDDFEDAQSSFDLHAGDEVLGINPEEAMFTIDELRELLSRATQLKLEGNSLYTSKPPKYEEAVQAYQRAIEHLPLFPSKEEEDSEVEDEDTGERIKKTKEGKEKEEKEKEAPPAVPASSGLQEISEEEAILISKQEDEGAPRQEEDDRPEEEKEREKVENEIKECTKACNGNLAACFIALKQDEKAVKACTEAIKIDPNYTKGLHRRATSNERIGSLTALSSAKEDYTLLLTLLPPSSPLLPSIRRSLVTLPPKIQKQEKEQYDEMMGKLKSLGNSLLGNFGLTTDNFKFEEQPGGGYSMNFSQ
ncbi:hypothetical protein L198_06870 [Cryptococcus wingfieldii CBS 7118]|uniref:Tetratricopeptide repeat protein 1 n=1 Tax=Cryptococcus wingfieldii CBS 7118 TaxID=1295528 RepID=A0A1E3IJH1_9TREE|nr:hypothetical protein L198_06870 [Cryptococcus wingfieldii CBS 7118]ODN88106.1 hypothetical protein L198_06870 [Cryptococcus wingfieldii CBS 7118]